MSHFSRVYALLFIDLHHYLALGTALRKILERFLGLLERKHLVDDRAETFGFEQFADPGQLRAIRAYEQERVGDVVLVR